MANTKANCRTFGKGRSTIAEAFDSYEKEGVAGLLEDRLKKGKERLEKEE